MGKSATKPKDAKSAAANDAADSEVEFDPNDADAVIAAAKVDLNNVIGNAGDFLIDEIKKTIVWQKASQKEQARLIKACGAASRALVAGVVKATAAKGLPHTEATLSGKGSFEEGAFGVKLSLPMTERNTRLLNESRGTVQLVFASANEFEGAMTAIAEPDEPALIPPAADKDGDGVEGQTFGDDESAQAETPAPTQAPAETGAGAGPSM